MSDQEKNPRLEILDRDGVERIENVLKSHGWSLEDKYKKTTGEYYFYKFKKGDISKQVAYLYSSATANRVYKLLDSQVDLIIIHGYLYKLESYAHGIETPVVQEGELLQHVMEWNEEAADGKIAYGGAEKPEAEPVYTQNYIQSENPIERIWQRIKQFKSKGLSKKHIAKLCKKAGIVLDDEILDKKAEGLAYCIQNAVEYYSSDSNDNLNQKIVNYYYGTIWLASAEMLANPNGVESLERVEKYTKFGHGLYTEDIEEGNPFEKIFVTAAKQGFFYHWIKFLGFNTENLPDTRVKRGEAIPQEACESLVGLFSRIPEISNEFGAIGEYDFNWLEFHIDSEAQPYSAMLKGSPEKSYAKITDWSARKSVEDIEMLPLPLSQIQYSTDEDEGGIHFRALVSHEGHQVYSYVLDFHRSSFSPARYIIPTFSGINSYKVISLMILYVLSIVVRYRPSIWREINIGALDEYLPLIESFIQVIERTLPEEFLKGILGEYIHVALPGGFNSLV